MHAPIKYFEKALEIDAEFYLAHWWMGTIYLQRSMLLKALKAFRKAGGLAGGNKAEGASFSYREALIGKRDKARELLDRLIRLSRQKYVSPVMIAAVLVALGERGKGRMWLRNANGVSLNLKGTRQGLQTALGADGVVITIAK